MAQPYNLFNLPDNIMKFSGSLGNLGQDLTMLGAQTTNPALYETLANEQLKKQQLEQEQQNAQRAAEMREKEFGLRKEELEMRRRERARQIAEQQAEIRRRNASLDALGTLSDKYAERMGISPDVARDLITSGTVGAGEVLGSLQKGVLDLMQPQELPQHELLPRQYQPIEYETIERDGFTQYVEKQPQKETVFDKANSLQNQVQQMDNMYERALQMPNFDKGELSRLSSLRENAKEKFDIAQSEIQNYDTLLNSKIEIEDRLLKDLEIAKNLIQSDSGGIGKIAPTRLLPGTKTGGLEGYVASFSPSTAAYSLNEVLSRVKSANVLEKLAEAKKQSKTGATGFGALSEKELKVVQDSKANLNIGQKDQELLRNINDVERDLKRQLSKIDKELNALGYQPEQKSTLQQGGWSIKKVR